MQFEEDNTCVENNYIYINPEEVKKLNDFQIIGRNLQRPSVITDMVVKSNRLQ